MFYPIFLDLHQRPVLIVGGGPIATGKVEGLLGAGAHVTVVAPEVSLAIAHWHAAGKLAWHAREFCEADIGDNFMVIAATADKGLNARVYRLADARQRVANAVDDLDHCNFIAPAITRAGAIQIAVSTSGKSPALAKQLRNRIESEILTAHSAALAEFLGRWRGCVKFHVPTYQLRLQFWEAVLASEIPHSLANGQLKVAQQHIWDMILSRTCRSNKSSRHIQHAREPELFS